jgi:integrase
MDTDTKTSGVVKITKTVVDESTPKAKRYVVWDGLLPGFGIRVEPSGHKVYFVRYRANGGGRGETKKDFTIGKHGLVTADQARLEARDALAITRVGGDPAGDKAERKAAKTVGDMIKHYLECYAVDAQLRPATIRQARLVFDNHALPKLGKMKLVDVKTADVRRAHAGAHETSGRYVANRMLAYVRKVFSLAIEAGERSDNPAKGVKSFPEDKRERYLSDDEAARFFHALDGLDDQNAADALRLLLLTGARRGEVLGARFEQFDLDAGIWTKPSAHTKQKKTHRLILEGPSLDIVRAIRAADPFGVFLFPGKDRTKPRADLKRPWEHVRVAADLKGVTVHSLRHSHASFLISVGVPLAVVGRGLGHTQAATTQRYAHVADQAQREAMAMVGRKLSGLADRKAGDLVALPVKAVD